MSFKDIRGQDRAINILSGHIEHSRLAGTYLFIGPEGVGKKLAARTLAKAVNCLQGEPYSCDSCVSCAKIENNQHPDVHIIASGDAEIKIEQVRQLQKAISLRPYEGKKKVFIIDNAHRLTPEASNALLKILEEPPGESLIILISDKRALLLKTIISRCRILRFSALGREQLQEILKKEYKLDNNTAHYLAYSSEGSLGAALGLKDTPIIVEKNRVIDKFLLSRQPGFDNLPMQNREQVRGYLNILAAWFRDMYLVKIGMPHSEIINFDRRDDLLKVMSHFSFLDLNEILDSIADSLLRLEQNINIRLLLSNLGGCLWRP